MSYWSVGKHVFFAMNIQCVASCAFMCHVESVVQRGLEQPTFVIKEHTLLSLYDWLRALVDISSFYFLVEFIDSLSL